MPKFIPSLPEIGREAIIVMAGALLATIIVKNVFPPEWRGYFNLTGGQQ